MLVSSKTRLNEDILIKPRAFRHVKFSLGCVIPADLSENIISDYVEWKNIENSIQVLLAAHISTHSCTFMYGNMKYWCFSYSRWKISNLKTSLKD